MNVKVMCRSVALACLAIQWTGYAAQQSTSNVEFVAAGMEEYPGRPSDRVTVKVYRGGGKEPLHTVEFNPRAPIKNLGLPPAAAYRVSFESYEPDNEGATACAASAQLEVAADQQYRVAFTVIKRYCLLTTGKVSKQGAYQEIARVDGTVRRLQIQKQ